MVVDVAGAHCARVCREANDPHVANGGCMPLSVGGPAARRRDEPLVARKIRTLRTSGGVWLSGRGRGVLSRVVAMSGLRHRHQRLKRERAGQGPERTVTMTSFRRMPCPMCVARAAD